MTKTILFTGGGSAGHVTPNVALFPQMRSEGYELHYAGTADGMERGIIEKQRDVRYHVVTSGKLSRFKELKYLPGNIAAPFRVLKGVAEAKRLMREIKPEAVFSKGGYVSVPVAIAASAMKIPVITHESDYTPGLANKIIAHYADKICVTFEDTLKLVGDKGVHTGTPIRPELYGGERARGLKFLGFSGNKPVLLIMGGSQGAERINNAVRASLLVLTQTFDIVHLCGRGKLDDSLKANESYRQYEYVSEELPDVFAATDIVVSRAGANAVFEFLALAKPAVLIPLPTGRGDQILNAGYFARKGYAMVLEQAKLDTKTLTDAVNDLYFNRLSYISTMSAEALADGTDEVLAVIRKEIANRRS